MKFRIIQSNDRGIITKVGDLTYHSRGTAKGKEHLEVPTLFIWVKEKKRLVVRAWTVWTGNKIGDDFIYKVTKMRDIIDISGENQYHLWCNMSLRIKLWERSSKNIQLSNIHNDLDKSWEPNRHKSKIHLHKRKLRLKKNISFLNDLEKMKIKNIYEEKDLLNLNAGYIKYHVDHIIPLSRGGAHHPNNLQILKAEENLKKGSKITLKKLFSNDK
tara:strand:+ start:141 stop:785 length:645 start_codon:yes stop_codon:yes gene_type:complete